MGNRLEQQITFVAQHDATPINKVIVTEHVLIESYKQLMQHQPDEATVAVFGVHRHDGIFEATDAEYFVPDKATLGGLEGASVTAPLLEKYYGLNKWFIAQFHSHPSGAAYVSSTDIKTSKRWSSLFASITPEGIVTFFGKPNYEVIGDVREIGKNQYKLNINNLEEKITFTPVPPEDQIEFEKIE